jgi:hypothetical protein
MNRKLFGCSHYLFIRLVRKSRAQWRYYVSYGPVSIRHAPSDRMKNGLTLGFKKRER